MSMHDVEGIALQEMSQADCRDQIGGTAKRELDLRVNGAAVPASDSNIVSTASERVDEFKDVGLASAEVCGGVNL